MKTLLFVSLAALPLSALAQEAWLPGPIGRVGPQSEGAEAIPQGSTTVPIAVQNKAIILLAPHLAEGPGFSVGDVYQTEANGPSFGTSFATGRITLRDGTNLTLQFEAGSHRLIRLKPESTGPVGERVPGWSYEDRYVDPSSGAHMICQEELRDDSNFVRVRTTITAGKADLDVAGVVLLDGSAPGAKVIGTVPGSPIVWNAPGPIDAGQEFMGVEYPTSHSEVSGDHATCWVERKLPIRAGQTVSYSAVVGVAPKGQLRRAFLRYVERERAHPYRPYLHYNCWYDLGWDDLYTEAQCIDRIDRFGEELKVKRGVKLSSYLFDDGWDDTNTTWEFAKGMPNGFAPLTRAASKYGAAPGAWLSPWGGYGDRRTDRLAAAKRNGYEVDSQGLALSGPKYYERFRQVCLNLEKQGVNQFKFDGTGSPDKQYPGSAFDSDFDAAIALIHDLRQAKPDLFVNLTTGTWPSPFWTLYADSIWRGAEDHSFAGVGSWRQKWITYRDGHTYEGVVQRGPLYPLNSLMLHGIIYAKNAEHLGDDPGDDFQDDVEAYFATGTQLQEMYITPTLLTPKNWDELAAGAKWAATHTAALKDVHWIGGDPLKLEVYGHAGWDGKDGYIELRNPSDKPQTFTFGIADALELPASCQGTFVWRDDSRAKDLVDRSGHHALLWAAKVGDKFTVELGPFEIVVYNLRPRN